MHVHTLAHVHTNKTKTFNWTHSHSNSFMPFTRYAIHFAFIPNSRAKGNSF